MPKHDIVISYDAVSLYKLWYKERRELIILRELIATNNLVTVSFVESLLKDASIDYLILDQNMSILEGSIGIIPRRIMVPDGLIRNARALLEDAGIGNELSRK